MSFGQTIKKLRRDADMTQEQLAELLMISPQAVSRWETDAAMPDISLLAPLANLFNVTTDSLLGVDIYKKDEKVRELSDEIHHLYSSDFEKWADALELTRKGLKQYPGEWELKYWLMFLLIWNHANGDKELNDKCIREAIPICEDIFANDTNEWRRQRAKLNIIRFGKSVGQSERAKELWQELPDVMDSKEALESWVVPDDERLEVEKKQLKLFLGYARSALWHMAYREKSLSPEERMELWRKSIALGDLVYEGDDYTTVINGRPGLQDAEMAADCGEIDLAFEMLYQSLERRYALCENEYKNFSPLLPKTDYDINWRMGMTKEDWRKELTCDIDIDDKVFIEKFLRKKLGDDERLDEYLRALDEFKEKYSK